VKEVRGICHKKFKTRSQAEAFIEDWKDSYAEVWRRAIREGLDRGLRPRDMTVNVESILRQTDTQTEGTDASDGLKLDKLNLKDE